NQESAVNAIIDKANKIKKFKDEIYRLAMSHMWRHPEKDAQKNQNVYPLANDVVIGELKGKKDILFSYNSCKYPSSIDNYLTFEGGIVIKTVGEEWVFPTINEITILFPNREERDKKYQEEFGKIGEAFAEAEETTPPPKKPEPTTETHATETGETGDTPQTETTGNSGQMPEQNTTPPPKPISVYDYFEAKLADEDQDFGLVNEDHIDSQRKFIKYEFLKNKLEEIYPQKKGSPSDGSLPSEDGLAQTKKNAIQTITAALNLEPAVKESELTSDTRAYEEKKEEIQTQKKRSALEDPDKYRRNVAIPGIKETMAKNDIKEDELDDETKRN
ncbi:33971_t:CDS:2, partial [Racocetra persica]